MQSTLNQAIEILEQTGDESRAFDVARQDDGMLPGVTQQAWVAFARDAIKRRRAEAESMKKYALIGY